MSSYNFEGEFPQSRIEIGNWYLNIRDDATQSPLKDFNTVGEVFLSSTFGDFVKYRNRISDDLSRIVGVYCPTIESQVMGGIDVVEACKIRVLKSHIFILLAGYWYGSIPPGYDKSITHMEFEWAQLPFAYNKEQRRPISIYMPEPGSEADEELKSLAQALVAKQYTLDDHEARMNQFRTAYSDWRMVNRFQDLSDLSFKVGIFCAFYKGATLENFVNGQTTVESKSEHVISDKVLGLLGRHKHFAALDDIFSRISKSAPVIGLVVTGGKNAGQHEFMLRVIRTQWFRQQERRFDAKSIEQRPKRETYTGLSTLIEWFATTLGVRGNKAPESISELAERITKELSNQQLGIIFDHIDFYGGINQFYQEFWQTFYAEMLRLRQLHQPRHRLICIVVDYTAEKLDSLAGLQVYQEEDSWDGSKLIALPFLKNITRIDLQLWFKKYTLVSEDREDSLISIALTDPYSKTEDGTPKDVFERLQGEDIRTDEEV